MIQKYLTHEASRKVAGTEIAPPQQFIEAVITALIVLACFRLFKALSVYIMNLFYEYFIQKNVFNL